MQTSSYMLLLSCWLLLCFTSISCQNYHTCDDDTFCNDDGVCYQSVDNPDTKLCSCNTDFHGNQCQHKVDDVFMYVVIVLAIISVLFFIAMVFIAYRLHTKACEFQDFKERIAKQKKEEEKKKKRQQKALLHKPRSRQPSVSSAGSRRSEEVTSKTGFLFDITATGIERTHSYTDDPDSVAIEIDKSDLNQRGLSLVDGANRLNVNKERKVSVSSASEGNSGLMPAVITGRPRSWAGPEVGQQGEDMNKIYKEYYGAHSDDEDAVKLSDRGYVRKSPTNSNSNLAAGNLHKFNEMTKARSMTDLRMLALQGRVPGKARSDVALNQRIKGARSVENIHTGKITVLTQNPRKSPVQHRRNQKKGIHARELERKQDHL